MQKEKKMSVFMVDGQVVSSITQDNAEAFRQWFWTEKNPEMERGIHVLLTADDLLAKILDTGAEEKKPPLTDEQQKYLARAVANGRCSAQSAKILIDVAADYPLLLGRVNRIAGNRSMGGGRIYTHIHDELEKRSLVDNLPAYHAILADGGVVHSPSAGNIGRLSPQNRRLLDDIFNRSQYGANRGYSGYGSRDRDDEMQNGATSFIRDILSAGQALNYEQASPEFRKLINEAVFYDGSRVREKLGRMKAKFYTPELLAEVLKKRYIPSMESMYNNTEKAKTQAEKNANILPSYYTKVRDALLKFAEKEEIHDRQNYGQLKSLTQRYQEMCARLTGARDWQSIPQEIKDGVMKDGCLAAAQKDILAGNAEKLSAETLQTVLERDKDNFYIRRIPQAIIKQKGLKLNYSKQLVSALEDKDRVLDTARIDELVTRTDLPLRDKEDLIRKEESREADRRPTREFLEREMAEYHQAVEEKNAQSVETAKKHFVADSIRRLQNAYWNITKNFKDNQPNTAEAHLSAEAVERLIADRLEGKDAQLSMPEQKSLPLLFGRKEEDNRRRWLNTAVSDFNRTLDDIMRGPEDYLKEMQPLKGKILAPETKEKTKLEEEESQRITQKLGMEFYNKYKETDRSRRQLEGLNRKTEELAKAKENIAFYKKALKDVADNRLGLKDGEPLRPVSEEMSPEEKRAVRRQNREVKDALAEKAATGKEMSDAEKIKAAKDEIMRAKYDMRR